MKYRILEEFDGEKSKYFPQYYSSFLFGWNNYPGLDIGLTPIWFFSIEEAEKFILEKINRRKEREENIKKEKENSKKSYKKVVKVFDQEI